MKKILGWGSGLWAGLLIFLVSAGMTLFFDNAAAGGTTLGLPPTAGVAFPGSPFGPESTGMTVFKQHCAICHGDEGHGDGPAAAGIRPSPANFTDPERVGDLSFEDMLGTVTNGKGYMPSFASVLRPEEIREVVTYIRTLKKDEGDS